MQNTKKSSQQSIKEANLKLVFGLICEREPISRADIKKITKLSATTVSSLVEELLTRRLVTEVGTKEMTTSGRKAILLNVNPEGGYLAGIEILKSSVVLDIYNLRFELIIHEEKEITDTKLLRNELCALLQTYVSDKKILGVTVGIPAVINPADGTAISSTVVDIDENSDITGAISENFPDCAVALCNTSGLIAYAEKEFGESVGALNLISIDINDGVGAGVLIEGNIYGGTNGIACEFGHVSVDYNGVKCKCGNYGCLEMTVSVPAILKKAGLRMSILDITLSSLIQKLEDGDETALQIMDETARVLAFGINNLVNIIDPEVIVICGKVCIFGSYLLTPLIKYRDLLALTYNKVNIKYSVLSENPVTIGGAKYAFDMHFAR